MGMVGCFYSLKDSDVDAIIESPPRIRKLWATPKPANKFSFLLKLLGVRTAPEEDTDPWMPSEKPELLCVDKAWHGIHFLLTGSDWEGKGPLAFILKGGRTVDIDFGYGPPRAFSSSKVKQIARALSQVNVEELYTKADPELLTAKEIYPNIWDEGSKDENIGYLIAYLKDLIEFVSRAAESNRELIVFIS